MSPRSTSYIRPRRFISTRRQKAIPLVGPYRLARRPLEQQRMTVPLISTSTTKAMRSHTVDAAAVVHPGVGAGRALIFVISTGMSSVNTPPPISPAQRITPAQRTRLRRAQHLPRRTCPKISTHCLQTKDHRSPAHVRHHMSNRACPRSNGTKDLRYQGRATILFHVPRCRRAGPAKY